MKVKVGLDPEQDLARVRAVRATVGPGVPLGVNANGGWSVHEAVEMVRRLRELDIHFVEQPVAPLDVAWMVEVRRRIELPVLADESLYSLQDAMALARAGAADLSSIYVGKAGGIGPARKIAAVAEAAGLGCTVGSNLELGVGSAATIHLALATPGIRPEQVACDITGPLFYEEDILVKPLPITGGRACPNDRPGLGVELDQKVVLHILDGAKGAYHGGPGDKVAKYVWPHRTMYFATDPVELDKTGWKEVDRKRAEMGRAPVALQNPDEDSERLNC